MSKIQLVAEAQLPTKFGIFRMVGFEFPDTHKEHAALVMGDISDSEHNPVLARIHSECLTGDALHSLKCDCGFQLETALRQISEAGRGVLIYHREEGRGIGLINKIRAYSLQDQGLDTIEANEALGFAADERNFAVCADIFELLGVKKVRLLTNNPNKIDTMREAGINVVERVALNVGENRYNTAYLSTKAEKMGHLIVHNHENKEHDQHQHGVCCSCQREQISE
ncbi:GTP cyclohydrolase II [Testudinibacter aquarius]|uniref:GTP cyclohydrolase-2 n=1 Tax=Testudinibacter aquarius TaxID=1524974 RepID=A0A4R3YHC2_9PAST|nr:GTP cyclohydrolase II [Testudinibacter aquarius]KAE9527457.1 GTP cyclohydrolase [Testudinibacter aquarius]TCV89983.1 GTP cyclohydrolase II [Testudinibacter aquarius]TNG93012.1 GTP cyclohydrolase II [Testudinibacter aquarius]